MVRAIAVLFAAFALTVGASSSALGSGTPLPEPGQRGCSVLAQVAPRWVRGADLWLRCGFQVSEISVSGINRSFRAISPNPALAGGAATDSLSCKLRAPKRIHCPGDVSRLTRMHIRLGVTRKVCRSPRMRLRVVVSGGPECFGYCPGVGYRAQLETSANRRKLGCVGS
jgi:hypothetical protein